MINSEEKRPVRAGRAYQDSLKSDLAAQDTWLRVQVQLRSFGELMRMSLESAVVARGVATESAADLLQPYRDLGAAVATALSGDFVRLRALVDAYPVLRPAADELEEAVRELHQRDTAESDAWVQRVRDGLAHESERCEALRRNLDDPAFWSGIVPIGEQIRDAVRAAMRELRSPSRDGVGVVEVIAQLEGYRAAGGPYLHQRIFARFCRCSPSTVNKAIKQDATLRQWKDTAQRGRKRRAAPRRDAGDFNIVTRQVAAAEAVVPITEEDRDRILELLRQHASVNPTWEEEFRGMSSDQRAELVRLCVAGDYELSPLAKDPPGRPRRTKYHGRV